MILVTGATGNAGGALVRALLGAGEHVSETRLPLNNVLGNSAGLVWM